MRVPGALRWVAAAVVVVAGIAAVLLDLAPAGDRRAGDGGSGQAGATAAAATTAADGGAAGGGDEGRDEGGETMPGTAPATGGGPAAGSDPAAELAGSATAAVAAWQTPDPDDRAAALAPLATPAWLEQSATIDPDLVPAAAVERSRLRVESDGRALVDVELADGTALAVVLVLGEEGRWLVDEILPTVPAAGAGGQA